MANPQQTESQIAAANPYTAVANAGCLPQLHAHYEEALQAAGFDEPGKRAAAIIWERWLDTEPEMSRKPVYEPLFKSAGGNFDVYCRNISQYDAIIDYASATIADVYAAFQACVQAGVWNVAAPALLTYTDGEGCVTCPLRNSTLMSWDNLDDGLSQLNAALKSAKESQS